MDYWHITIRSSFNGVAVRDELADVAQTLLADHIGHVAVSPDGERVTARLYVIANDAASATGKGLRTFQHVATDAKWPSAAVTEVHARRHLPATVTTVLRPRPVAATH